MSERIEQDEDRKSHIPEFQSYEEEADWWDTTDTGDPEYEGEFRPIEARFAKNLSQGLKVRFDPETISKLRECAKEKGIGPTTLIRMWVIERLNEDEKRKAS
jgi:CopG antitoxin of type II toxin-antitoxin system